MQPDIDAAAKKLLQIIYSHFLESATWPTYRSLEIDFRAELPLHDVAAKIDRKLIKIEDIFREDAICSLTLEGLAKCDGSSRDIQNIIDTAAMFARHYIENKGSVEISSDDIEIELGLSQLEVRRVCEVYWRLGWPLTGGGSRSQEGNFSEFKIHHNAMLFEGVKTLEDFYERINDVEQKEKAERRLNLPTPLSQSSAICSMAHQYTWCSKQTPVHVTKEVISYCAFHSPRGKKDLSLEEFNRLVVDEIRKAKEANITCDLSGTIFEGSISFRELDADNSFPKVRLCKCEFSGSVDFDGLSFADDASFQEAIFQGNASFRNAQFRNDAIFFRTSFKQRADFEGAIFSNGANYGAAIFNGPVTFALANFIKDATFTKVEFKDEVNYWQTTFAAMIGFGEARFRKGADFEGIVFNGDANFTKAEFSSVVDFTNTEYHKEMYFEDAVFDHAALFMYSKCHGKAHFQNARFKGQANFSSLEFQNKSNFIGTKYYKEAYYSGCVFDNIADFTGAQFGGSAVLDHAKFKSLSIFADAEFKGRSSFEKTIFERLASFSDASFSSKASFSRTEFRDVSRFEDVRFHNEVDFSDVAFSDKVNFDRATFNDAAFFFGRTFSGGASLRNLNMKAGLRLEKVNLRQVSLLDTDLRMMDFVNCDWNRGYGREMLYDEISFFNWPYYITNTSRDVTAVVSSSEGLMNNIRRSLRELSIRTMNCFSLIGLRFKGSVQQVVKREWQGFIKDIFSFLAKDNINKVENSYRYLKQKYKDIHDEQMASNWHYGEKEMFRKKNFLRRYLPLSLSNLYWVSSGYGERPFRAGLFLVFFLVAFSLSIDFAGIGQQTNASDIATRDVKGFGSVLLNTLQIATFQKEVLFEPHTLLAKWIRMLIQICIPLQSTLFVFALRNRFRR